MSPAGFARIMGGGDGAVALDEAALAISATLQPGLDEIEWLAALDQLAADCPTPTPEGIARHLVDGEGFTGNRLRYDDWRNSCLDRVIATRQGIPITLAVVMIEVARRLGVGLVGIGMPGHFLVGVAGDAERFFDPFHTAAPLDRADVRRRFTDVSGARVPWRDDFLEPSPNRAIVTRMLNNLKAVFARRGDRVRLAQVMELRSMLPELAVVEAAEITRALATFN